MSLMAIIMWALHPLSPWRRYYELARWLLDVLIRNIQDPRTVDWLCAYPDDPRGIPHFERAIDDLNAGIDLLIYIRAREVLGLKPGRWRRPKPSPPQRRRSRTFSELYARLRACGLRFSEIERLATRRAEKLKRLLTESDIILDAPAHAALLESMHDSIDRGICLHLSPRDWADGLPRRSAAKAGGGSHARILGARAPPVGCMERSAMHHLAPRDDGACRAVVHSGLEFTLSRRASGASKGPACTLRSSDNQSRSTSAPALLRPHPHVRITPNAAPNFPQPHFEIQKSPLDSKEQSENMYA